jgi:deoxycytidylate deaminase
MIINAGIKRVVYAGHYPDDNAVAFLTEAGVELQHWEPATVAAAAPEVKDNESSN